MFAARVGKRICGLAISSGTNWDRSLGPETGYDGTIHVILGYGSSAIIVSSRLIDDRVGLSTSISCLVQHQAGP